MGTKGRQPVIGEVQNGDYKGQTTCDIRGARWGVMADNL